MSKTTRLYQDSRTANAASSHMDKLNDDLQDVTRIMTKNMEELLWRGDSLDRESSFQLISDLTDQIPFLLDRNVPSIDVTTFGI